jgi:predicted transcriptional regulator
MVRLQKEYEDALEFRKRGFTYSEIAKITGVSKATVSSWCSKKLFSRRVAEDNRTKAARDNAKRMMLLNKARTAERKKRYDEAQTAAVTEFRHYRRDSAFIAGLVAYRAKGDLSHPSRIRLTSSDPFFHRMFILFLEEYLGIDKKKVRFSLSLSEGTDEGKARALWRKKVSLPAECFYKSQVLPHSGRALQHGTGHTIIGSTILKKRLLAWVGLLEKEVGR